MVREEEENEAENLVLGLCAVYYSAQDVDELHQEWQETHQQELIDLQQCMQAQLNAQLAKSREQGNLGSTVQYPPAGVMPMGQLGLSMTSPVFVPRQGPTGIGATFYNLTPCTGDHTQQIGSVSRSMDRTEPVNVYGSFQKAKLVQRPGYGDHRIADPVV